MNNREGRERILKAAIELLKEHPDSKNITMKAIAERSGVGVGLINYHFKSKDRLFMEAVGKMLAFKALQWRAHAEALNDLQLIKPLDKEALVNYAEKQLKQMLTDLMDLGAEHMKLVQLVAAFELMEGHFNSPEFILPYIKVITGQTDAVSQLTAINLMSGIQTATVRQVIFKAYTGFDLTTNEGRSAYIETLILTLKGVSI